MGSELLRMEGISKRFPGVKALDNVSLVVNEGQVHALLGENGAGKSTLIKILNGVYTPDEGEIYVRGRKVNIDNISDAQNLKIGIIFQEFNLCPDVNVANNVFINRQKRNRLGFVDDRFVEKETQEILDRLGLTIRPTDLVRNMSVSQMQMVEIAKAMSFNSDIMVFDEPTAALSEGEIEKLFEIIQELRRCGKGIIYISHRMDELRRIADRVTVLRDGAKVGESFDYAKKTMDELIAMMVGRKMENQFPTYIRKAGDILFEAKNIKSKKLKVDYLYVRRGEIVGIAGLMGAGRTELARGIFGADKLDSIELSLKGKTIINRSPEEAVHNGIAYLTEDRKEEGLALSMSCEKNINMASWELFSRVGFISKRKAVRNAETFIDKLQIKTSSLSKSARLLSGGNQQKLVVAKWLTRSLDLFIFDEPTRGIDVGVKYEMYKLLNTLSGQGAAVILISSELPELLGMSDRIYAMHSGRIVGELKTRETNQEEILSYIAGVKG